LYKAHDLGSTDFQILVLEILSFPGRGVFDWDLSLKKKLKFGLRKPGVATSPDFFWHRPEFIFPLRRGKFTSVFSREWGMTPRL